MGVYVEQQKEKNGSEIGEGRNLCSEEKFSYDLPRILSTY
jgi:hypothetical protein